MRKTTIVLSGLLCSLWARAQTPPPELPAAGPESSASTDAASGEEQHKVSVTAFFFVNGQTTAPAAVGVTAALRRGLLDNDELEFKDPTDAMSTTERRDAADAAVALLQEARRLVEQGSYAEAQPHLTEALSRFEENLALIKKKDLTDALMLLGVVQCGTRRRNDCVDTFVRVLTFRDGLVFDPARYPAMAAPAFEQAQERLRRIARGSIEVRTEPEGAEVFVDGRSRGASPLVIEGLRVGDHYVTIKLPGYEKFAARLSVARDFQQTYEYQLERSDQFVVLQQALRRVPPEIGAERAGPAIRELRDVLFVDQVVLGKIDDQAGQLAIDVCLYDLRTGLRLKQLRLNGRLSEPNSLADLARRLYSGVDLRGFVEAPPPPPPPPPPPSRSVFTKWWFWGIVGVVVAGGLVVYGFSDELAPDVESGTTRVDFRIQTSSGE
ncbi:MAG: PEGA domain-containing protein [Deltaproteobacteria bacterium]|nr:PEGA domain-containing protein [Deltaproteobacteria bacterium]